MSKTTSGTATAERPQVVLEDELVKRHDEERQRAVADYARFLRMNTIPSEDVPTCEAAMRVLGRPADAIQGDRQALAAYESREQARRDLPAALTAVHAARRSLGQVAAECERRRKELHNEIEAAVKSAEAVVNQNDADLQTLNFAAKANELSRQWELIAGVDSSPARRPTSEPAAPPDRAAALASVIADCKEFKRTNREPAGKSWSEFVGARLVEQGFGPITDAERGHVHHELASG